MRPRSGTSPNNKQRHTAAYGGWTRHCVPRLCAERYVSKEKR